MKTTFTLLLCLTTFLCTSVRAQNNADADAGAMTASVTGRVLDGSVPTEFMNVLLVTAADSQVVKLELADESGVFVFSNLPPADYFVRTSGIGYADTPHPVFTLTTGQELTLPDYNLKGSGTTLETVEVIARKPFLEQKAGMLVVNVDQSITGQGGSVLDMLRKVPGIVIAGTRIQMAGKSGLTILIDGRPTKYMDINSLLRDMPADNIKSIEVISQPGA